MAVPISSGVAPSSRSPYTANTGRIMNSPNMRSAKIAAREPVVESSVRRRAAREASVMVERQ